MCECEHVENMCVMAETIGTSNSIWTFFYVFLHTKTAHFTGTEIEEASERFVKWTWKYFIHNNQTKVGRAIIFHLVQRAQGVLLNLSEASYIMLRINFVHNCLIKSDLVTRL